MLRIFLVGILAASPCCAQDSTLLLQQPPVQAQSQSPASAPSETFTVPAATRLPMKLTSPINSTSRRGDPVRASIAFPVTVGTQLAMPVGTYAEGVIDKISKRGPKVQMHFTRVVYSNGYTVPLDATNALAQVRTPIEISSPAPSPAAVNVAAADFGTFQPASGPMPDAAEFSNDNDYAPDPAANMQQPPPTQPASPPKVGPSIGEVTGIGLGVAAAALIAFLVVAHHHVGSSYVLFDTSWQFDLILQTPLTLDATKVTAAINASAAE